MKDIDHTMRSRLPGSPEIGGQLTYTEEHRRRASTGSARPLVMIAVVMSASLLFAGPTFARDRLLREDLEAWWSQLQAKMSPAKKPCIGATGSGCSRREMVRTRKSDDEAMAGRATLYRRGMRQVHISKQGRAAVTARAEARESVDSDADRASRHDRPGKYFLHGPRF
ncbi:hypothetical protein ACQR1I_28320 [Bradyrhizobium sp. HKCCYLS2038]|uniref:hypothetical protein n=1 Tax=unclassified Bradyrhizobium TaxID=2631580 RepID=UPI003EB72243